jgi:hypothetical protein
VARFEDKHAVKAGAILLAGAVLLGAHDLWTTGWYAFAQDRVDAVRWALFGLGITTLAMRPRTSSMPAVAVVCAVGVLSLLVWTVGPSPLAPRERRPGMSALLDWVRGSDLHGPFLFPVDSSGGLNTLGNFDDFQLRAGRTAWVEWRQGAAVMWDPSFEVQWMSRFREVSALRSPQEFYIYASSRNIPYFILPESWGTCPTEATVVYQNAGYAVCSTKR